MKHINAKGEVFQQTSVRYPRERLPPREGREYPHFWGCRTGCDRRAAYTGRRGL